ncbi:hypothetical protein DB346_08340 [Verrucomicrobia bacterium LW23]|nr:hypothetical protein DB346_08340 [Verrucomicrobia bacterium LW23]
MEVTLALGLVTFCLLLLMGLMLSGLNSMKASRDEVAAVSCLEQISDAIRSGIPTGTSTYQGGGPYGALTWTIGGAPVTYDLTNLSAGGYPTLTEADQIYAARVEITPPPDGRSPGRAMISVAWPRKSATWNSGTSSWENAQGSTGMWVYFLPGQ